MTPITAEFLDSLTTEQLHELYWDWYKECEGIRPRWTSPDDREGMLRWCKHEIQPESVARRQQEWAAEEAWIREQEEAHEERVRELREEEEREYQLLHAPMGYPGERYEYLEAA